MSPDDFLDLYAASQQQAQRWLMNQVADARTRLADSQARSEALEKRLALAEARIVELEAMRPEERDYAARDNAALAETNGTDDREGT